MEEDEGVNGNVASADVRPFLEKADEPGEAQHESNWAKTGHNGGTMALAVVLHKSLQNYKIYGIVFYYGGGTMEGFKEIDIQQAKELIDQGDIIIVDIRDQNSFEQGHIENAISINDSSIEEFANITDKSKPILCYCYMGFSSQGASQYLKDKGFETVYNLIGGFTEWQNVHNISGKSSNEN